MSVLYQKSAMVDRPYFTVFRAKRASGNVPEARGRVGFMAFATSLDGFS